MPKGRIRLILFFIVPILITVSAVFVFVVLFQEWDASCEGRRDAPPCGPGVEIGKRYSYILHTHCGIRSVHFDGRWWVADPILRFNGAHPPPGWDNPQARGKIELIAQDRARFTNRAGLVTDFVARFTGTVGLVAEFRPLPEGEERPPGGLCA